MLLPDKAIEAYEIELKLKEISNAAMTAIIGYSVTNQYAVFNYIGQHQDYEIRLRILISSIFVIISKFITIFGLAQVCIDNCIYKRPTSTLTALTRGLSTPKTLFLSKQLQPRKILFKYLDEMQIKRII